MNKLFEAFGNIFRVPDLRKRVLFTLALLAVYRLGSHIPTSAQKKVYVSVYDTVKAAQCGSFKVGEDQIFDLKSDGVGLGKINADGQKYASKVDEIKQKIISGEIKNIPDTVK